MCRRNFENKVLKTVLVHRQCWCSWRVCGSCRSGPCIRWRRSKSVRLPWSRWIQESEIRTCTGIRVQNKFLVYKKSLRECEPRTFTKNIDPQFSIHPTVFFCNISFNHQFSLNIFIKYQFSLNILIDPRFLLNISIDTQYIFPPPPSRFWTTFFTERH